MQPKISKIRRNPSDALIAFIYHNEKLPILINGDITISLTKKQVELVFLSNFEVYHEIEMDEIFHYQREARQLTKGGRLKPNFDYEITMILRPVLIPQLSAHAATGTEAIEYLSYLSATQFNADLLKAENWFVSSVKQNQNGKEVELRTLWSEADFNSDLT